jgi:MurNAc alpha-1-phosphate uridylyltransferase
MPKPRTAMVFAAGLGTRMRPITDHTPKPMISVAGKTLLERILDKLLASHIEHAVINTHHLAPLIEKYVALRRSRGELPHVDLSHEETLLETGGGIVHAKPFLGSDPVYTINSDIIWLDGKEPALDRLAKAWDPEIMDALLLLHPITTAVGYEGDGNFDLLPTGQLIKPAGGDLPYVYAGVQIINPTFFYGMREEPFSLNVLYKKAYQSDGRLNRIYGLVHDGKWFHVGTPDMITKVAAQLVHDS